MPRNYSELKMSTMTHENVLKLKMKLQFLWW